MAAQYSDDQIKEYMDHVRTSAGSHYTPDQLNEYEQHVRDTAGPKAPGFAPETPADTDLYGDPMKRIQASFGDPQGIAAAHLLKQGFSKPLQNSNGDLVTQAPDGKWYRDGFVPKPGSGAVNKIENGLGRAAQWGERNIGGLPGMAGMMLGGVAGAGLASVPMAALGASAGEAVRQDVGKYVAGSYKGANANADLGDAAIGGGLGELGGKVLGAVAKPITSRVIPVAAKAAGSMMSKLSGVDADAIERTIMRRGNVFSPPATQDLAKQGAAELGARDSAEGTAIQQARGVLRSQQGSDVVPTAGVLNETLGNIDRAAPNANGEGQLTPQEVGFMRQRAIRNLTEPLPDGQEGPRAPRTTLESLSKYADGLQNDNATAQAFKRSGLPVDGSSRATSINQRQLGQVKGVLHDASSPYAAADAQFHQFADQSKLLKPLTNEGTQQSFVDSLANSPTRDNARDAAAALTPKFSQGVQDLSANRAWGKPGPTVLSAGGLKLSGRDLLRLGLVAGGGASSFLTNDPTTAGVGLTAAALMSPTLQYKAIQAGIPLAKQIPAALMKRAFTPYQETK